MESVKVFPSVATVSSEVEGLSGRVGGGGGGGSSPEGFCLCQERKSLG